MVYVKIPIKQKTLMPKYVGPAVVLKSRGKVITIRWLNGKTEKVNVERCKPVHKLRPEFADVHLPVPERLSSLIASECAEVHSEHSIDMFSYTTNSFSIAQCSSGASSLVVLAQLSERYVSTFIGLTNQCDEMPSHSATQEPRKAITVCFHKTPGKEFPRRSQRIPSNQVKVCPGALPACPGIVQPCLGDVRNCPGKVKQSLSNVKECPGNVSLANMPSTSRAQPSKVTQERLLREDAQFDTSDHSS